MTQEREFSEMRLQLERLANLESLLAASNGAPLLAKNEEVGVSVVTSSRPSPLETAPAASRKRKRKDILRTVLCTRKVRAAPSSRISRRL
jgi:hypothetical protein